MAERHAKKEAAEGVENEDEPAGKRDRSSDRIKSIATATAAVAALITALAAIFRPEDTTAARTSYDELSGRMKEISEANARNHDDLVALHAFLEGYLGSHGDRVALDGVHDAIGVGRVGGMGHGLGAIGGAALAERRGVQMDIGRPAIAAAVAGGPRDPGSSAAAPALSAEAVRRVAMEHQPELMRCYGAAVAHSPSFHATARATLHLGAGGAVESVSFAWSPPPDPGVERCIGAAIRGWNFGAVASGAIVELPLELQAVGAAPADAKPTPMTLAPPSAKAPVYLPKSFDDLFRKRAAAK